MSCFYYFSAGKTAKRGRCGDTPPPHSLTKTLLNNAINNLKIDTDNLIYSSSIEQRIIWHIYNLLVNTYCLLVYVVFTVRA